MQAYPGSLQGRLALMPSSMLQKGKATCLDENVYVKYQAVIPLLDIFHLPLVPAELDTPSPPGHPSEDDHPSSHPPPTTSGPSSNPSKLSASPGFASAIAKKAAGPSPLSMPQNGDDDTGQISSHMTDVFAVKAWGASNPSMQPADGLITTQSDSSPAAISADPSSNADAAFRPSEMTSEVGQNLAAKVDNLGTEGVNGNASSEPARTQCGDRIRTMSASFGRLRAKFEGGISNPLFAQDSIISTASSIQHRGSTETLRTSSDSEDSAFPLSRQRSNR